MRRVVALAVFAGLAWWLRPGSEVVGPGGPGASCVEPECGDGASAVAPREREAEPAPSGREGGGWGWGWCVAAVTLAFSVSAVRRREAGPMRIELEVLGGRGVGGAAPEATFAAAAVDREHVDGLRRRVRDVDVGAAAWLKGDAALLRFLAARGHRRSAAEDAWRRHVAWRRDFGVDALVAAAPSPELRLCRKWWPVGLLAGLDHDGAPVDYHRLGSADLPGVEREVGRDAFLRFVALLNEECFAALRRASATEEPSETPEPPNPGPTTCIPGPDLDQASAL